MNEEERRLYELGFGYMPVATTGYTATTPLYSEAGVPMSNENLSFFGAAPVPTSPSMNVDYSQVLSDVGIEPTTSGMAEVDLPFFNRFPLA